MTTEAHSQEIRIELLKERIYATIVVLAELITLDGRGSSATRAALLVATTSVSLWAASLIAARMSYRVVTGRREPWSDARRQLIVHSPLLAASAFPLATIGLASIGAMTTDVAINSSIAACVLVLVGWSLQSARAVGASRVATAVIATLELGIGLGIVWLKASLAI